MHILITGAAGFLGSHLADRFLTEGHHVLGVDNLVTGSRRNLAHLEGESRFELIEHDISEPLFLERELDGVLHLASPASPVDYLELPIQTLKVGALGTHNTLGIALKHEARYLLASTSEVYGDPAVHPQPESYWGHVNPIGPRGVYDEAKRFAEAMTMAYHRYHGVDTRIARIFNSVMADETVLLFNDDEAHIQEVESYVDSVTRTDLVLPRKIKVPAFNPRTLEVEICEADALIKHPSNGNDGFRIRTRYGRHIRVTGDHSVFRRSGDGAPEAVPVRQLEEGDYVAIPGRLPVVEKDLPEIDLARHMMEAAEGPEDLWGYKLRFDGVEETLDEHRDVVFDYLLSIDRYDASRYKRNTVGCSWRAWKKRGAVPLAVLFHLVRKTGFSIPTNARITPYGSGGTEIPNRIPVTKDLLWLLGLFVAEGCHVEAPGNYRVLISSDERFVERAADTLAKTFDVSPAVQEPGRDHPPTTYVDSKALLYAFRDVFQVTGFSSEVRIPPWIFQLPLSRLKHFLEGYRHGDGTHTDYPEKRELAFNTVSEGLATDLIYVLLRFGIVGCLGQYETTYKAKYGDRRFPFWRVTVCEVSDFDILTWDRGVDQTLNARRTGDLVWAKVNEIEPVEVTKYVYDFSVEGYENFIAGNGVFAHNTYGPRMRPADGRVVSNFIVQALRGEPLTVYGDGSQTRSFCYVDDEIEGLYRLFNSSFTDPVNIGNPNEFTIMELAKAVLEEIPSESTITHLPLPEDDPQVRRPDISLARELLDWAPVTSLREGLRKTIPYFRKLVQEEDAEARVLGGGD